MTPFAMRATGLRFRRSSPMLGRRRRKFSLGSRNSPDSRRFCPMVGRRWLVSCSVSRRRRKPSSRSPRAMASRFIGANSRKKSWRRRPWPGRNCLGRIWPNIAAIGSIPSPTAMARSSCNEIPPNGQGLAALIMLGIVEHHDITRYALDSADFFHLQIEAMKLALADARRYVADPAHLEFPVQRLLEADYLERRAALVDMGRARLPRPRRAQRQRHRLSRHRR